MRQCLFSSTRLAALILIVAIPAVVVGHIVYDWLYPWGPRRAKR